MYFENMIDLIPIKHYRSPEESEEEETPWKGKGFTGEEKAKRKQLAKQVKKAHLDPEQNKTTTETIKELESVHKATEFSVQKKEPSTISTSNTSLEDLRARLYARIEHLRAERHATNSKSKRENLTGSKPHIKKDKKQLAQESSPMSSEAVHAVTGLKVSIKNVFHHMDW
jgi:uncharacterized protein with von Willebrand factor type A (vWA) domain